MDDSDQVEFGEDWRLWRQFGLRGAGFPADGVLRLAPPGLAEAADRVACPELSGPDWDAFAAAFAAGAVRTARQLQAVAATEPFRTAVAWQNRAVLRTGIAPFLAWAPTAAGRTSMPRQREELVAHYWQRFCVKNDTIGFFGPVGWGALDEAAPGIAVEPGAGLVAGSTVYFAGWALDTLAATITADPALRDWIAPRRLPFLRVTADGVVVPGRPPQPVSAAERRVLDRCDGVRPARDIRAALPDVADLDAVLETLVRRRWVVWRLELPADARPETHLRSWLAGVGEEELRRPGLDLLDRLERGRARVAAATDTDELDAALADLERDFTAATAAAAARTRGRRTPPGRALVYADCRRSARARVGADVLAALAPLESVLLGASWLAAELADRVLARLREVHAGLAGGEPVDLATFWFACLPVLHGDAVTAAAEVQRDFQRRWAEILGPVAGRQVWVAPGRVAERARDHFGKRGRAWTAARYLSPDVLVAAADAAAVERGDYTLVLGELHTATNTLGASLFVHQHPAPAELHALTDADHPGPRLLPLLPKEHRARLSTRVRYALVRDQDYCVALVDHTADPGRPRTYGSADVQVRAVGDDLVVVLPDGARFPVLDVFGHVLTTLVMDLAQLLPQDGPHTPRVTVGRLVVARERWSFPVAGLAFATEKDEARRFVRARRWGAREGLPRFLFATVPTEPRPFLVDLASPVSVTILAKAARRLARQDPDGRVTLTEMLPTPQQAWLTDDAGRRYTSELRFVAVDQRPG